MTGLDGTPMASFADNIKGDQGWDLVHYLRTLQPLRTPESIVWKTWLATHAVSSSPSVRKQADADRFALSYFEGGIPMQMQIVTSVQCRAVLLSLPWHSRRRLIDMRRAERSRGRSRSPALRRK